MELPLIWSTTSCLHVMQRIGVNDACLGMWGLSQRPKMPKQVFSAFCVGLSLSDTHTHTHRHTHKQKSGQKHKNDVFVNI